MSNDPDFRIPYVFGKTVAQIQEENLALRERNRVQERLLISGNTLAVVVVAALSILAEGGEVKPVTLVRLRDELREWHADVCAVASEEMP